MRIVPITSDRFAAAYSLDLIAGDPQAMPHPVRLIGGAISLGERWLLRPGSDAQQFLCGAFLTATVVAGSWVATRMATRAGAAAEVLLAWTTIATRSLLDESGLVLDALDRNDLPQARRRLGMIVGRDTAILDGPEILRAIIETVAEGLCDGIVAPLFYLALGGVPLAFAYKAVNTLDSMIGHPEPPYRYFGRVAARLDDFANFIPARIAACAIVAMSPNVRRSWSVLLRDGDRHPSPNAGRPEAAMAGVLGVRLGGMNYYAGRPSPKPLIGGEGRCATRQDARAALRITAVASLIVFSAAWVFLRCRERNG
jgi:adenosylcobinamide-phosphate synthase